MRAAVSVTTGGIPSRMRAIAAMVPPDIAKAVYRTGAMYRTRVRAAASGRPGPRVQTGDYRRRIAQTNTMDGQVPVALIHTNAPQAARLEYGFVGEDALGRRYNQPPYPHWGPAAEGMEKVLAMQAERTISVALGRIWRS